MILLQFRERYKGYRIPLSSLRVGRAKNKLGYNVDGKDGELPNILNLTSSGEVEEGVTLEHAPGRRGRGRPKKMDSDDAPEEEGVVRDEFDGRFVELVDVLPEVPKKGEFDVNTIKRSLYFFS